MVVVDMTKENRSVCIVSSVEEPSLAGIVPIRDMVNLFDRTHGRIILVTSSKLVEAMEGSSPKLETYRVDRPNNGQLPYRLVHYLLSQLRNARIMLKIGDEVDEWLFFVGGDTQFLPAVLARISGKPVHQLFGAASKETMRTYGRGAGILVPLLSLASRINCALATQIVVYSENNLREYGLEPFRHKTVVSHRHVIDLDHFQETVPLAERGRIVAFMARLAHEKGIREFLEAVPLILDRDPDIHIRIYGTGMLEEEVRRSVGSIRSDRVEVMGWVAHRDMPLHLNQIKMLVMPSYAEGLPNVMLEAMACGAAVLVNPVGSISEVVTDGVTGYLMHGNDPEEIAYRTLSTLERDDLLEVASRGKDAVVEEFTFDRQVEKWRRLFYP